MNLLGNAVVMLIGTLVALWPARATQTPTPSLSKTLVNSRDGSSMLLIAAGAFLMGDDDQENNPRRTVSLPDYYISKNLVTVGQFRKFCRVTGRKMPQAPSWGWKEDHP